MQTLQVEHDQAMYSKGYRYFVKFLKIDANLRIATGLASVYVKSANDIGPLLREQYRGYRIGVCRELTISVPCKV